MKHIKLSAIFFILSYALNAQQNAPQLGKNSIKEVIAAMTAEEKAKLVVGMGFRFPGAPANRRNDSSNRNRKRDTTLVTTGFNLPPSDPDFDKFPEKVPGAAGRTHPIPRLGIPSITVSDGPAGVRISPIRNGDSSKTYYATAFPVATLLASSWDTALVRKVGVAFGSELHEYGIDVLLAPALNIHRNPLGGRNFEYYSEDPLVAGLMTAAIVNGIQSNGVGTSIKHFAANNQETNRNSVNTIVSERTLREIYLKGFEIAVKKSQPWTVMSSYNKINGTYASERRDLITDVLRGEWNFKGFVMTDWFGGKDAVAQMNAGNDLLMPGNPNQVKAVLDAINDGTISKAQIDENVERILKIILKSPSFKKYKNSDKPDLKKDAQVTRTAAAEGMVLLKNEASTLPLKTKNVALFGNTSYDIIAGGTGSGDVNKAYTVSLVEGLTNAGYNVNAPLKNAYSTYLSDQKAKRPKPRFFVLPPPIPELPIDDNTLQQEANDADVAVITLGRNAGEGADRKVENDFNLSDTEHILIKSIATAFHAKGKKVLVVLNIGGVIEVTSWKDDVDAILLTWQPGLEAGNSIVDIISGKVNPSGKLATTFPVAYTDVPSAKNFPGKELPQENKQPANAGPFSSRPSEVIYEDGIYVGYRYYNTFNVKPAYEFGYGLSYTDFSYGNLKLSSSNFLNKITATITITNKGSAAGKEVAELYISAPSQKLDKPSEELKGFTKTRLLKPGESQTVTFTINASDLASFDTNSSSWIAEAGKYTVKVGSSSINFNSSATFNLAKEIITEKDKKELAPQVDISELKK
jgi:beta-glucosidase